MFEPAPIDDECFDIADVTIIKHGKVIWIPETKTVNGMQFIGLSKWNRDFVKFVTGKGLGFGNTQSNQVNSAFFDNVLAARKQASIEAVTKALEYDEAPEGDLQQEGSKRRAKRSKKHSWSVLCSSEALADPVIEIVADGFSMQVLTELRSNMVWVELTKNNLAFIQKGVQASARGKSYKRKSVADGEGELSDERDRVHESDVGDESSVVQM